MRLIMHRTARRTGLVDLLGDICGQRPPRVVLYKNTEGVIFGMIQIREICRGDVDRKVLNFGRSSLCKIF